MTPTVPTRIRLPGQRDDDRRDNTATLNGTAQLGKRTKHLVKRLKPGDIAIIDHEDIDRVSAETLVASGVKAVVNAASSISGRYPNIGPGIIVDAGVLLLDEAGQAVFDDLEDNLPISLKQDTVYLKDKAIATGTVLTKELIEQKLEAAEETLDTQMEQFVTNTVEYIDRQKGELIFDPWVPPITTEIRKKQVLVVVRGYDYREDLNMLRPYIREMHPVLIGVDGGADALLESGFKPHIIIGDMDSVSDKALLCGAEVIAHAFEDGTVTASEHMEELGLAYTKWPLPATSEDLALLLAWVKKADLIVALGTHSNLVEYLDKGRSGMASSFLIRLKVGTKLVDAKGVSKLYRATPPAWQIPVIVLSFLAVLIIVIAASPPLREIFTVIWLNLRFWLGI
ncbi:MAG: putative cytokinetic ring protein SteA [Coriobacteriia bacterium]|nr:putative cytokinetic ring protein SteA [Coriobacteriia bacterium]